MRSSETPAATPKQTLTTIFGSVSAARVLTYISFRGDTYAKEVADHYGLPVNLVQRQLSKLESAGILESELVGRTRLFTWARDYREGPLLAAWIRGHYRN